MDPGIQSDAPSDILSDILYLKYNRTFYLASSLTLSGINCDILFVINSDILPDIDSEISCGKNSGILSGENFDILSDIILTFYLT